MVKLKQHWSFRLTHSLCKCLWPSQKALVKDPWLVIQFTVRLPTPLAQQSINSWPCMCAAFTQSDSDIAHDIKVFAMDPSTEQPTETSVRFAPRLTEDSLPVTLPKDAERAAENASAGEPIQLSYAPEDKPVSAGVLDLQLVPQVQQVDMLVPRLYIR